MLTKQAEMTDNQKLMLRTALTAGGGAAGYLGSRYLLDIKDTPLNMLAGAAGAGAGIVGSEAMINQAKTENEADAAKQKTIEDFKQKGAADPGVGNSLMYDLVPGADKASLAGLGAGAVTVGVTVPKYMGQMSNLKALEDAQKDNVALKKAPMEGLDATHYKKGLALQETMKKYPIFGKAKAMGIVPMLLTLLASFGMQAGWRESEKLAVPKGK